MSFSPTNASSRAAHRRLAPVVVLTHPAARSGALLEGIGLLPTPEREPSGYRDYNDHDVDRLRCFIPTAQRLGLSLRDASAAR